MTWPAPSEVRLPAILVESLSNEVSERIVNRSVFVSPGINGSRSALIRTPSASSVQLSAPDTERESNEPVADT